MKKIFKTLIPIVTIGATAGLIVPITSCAKNDSVIAGIVITSKPTKVSYAKGEYLDLTGLEVKLVRKDGRIELTDKYTVSMQGKTRLNTEGKYTITVTSSDSPVSDSFDIEVGAAKVCKLEVTHDLNAWQVPSGTPLSLDGLKVKATWTDDKTNEDYKDYTTEPAAGTVLSKWGRNKIRILADQAETETSILVLSEAVEFADATWENISDWTYFLETKDLLESDFRTHFTINGVPPSSLNEYVGIAKKVTINNKEHIVRVIGVNHDTIDSPEWFPEGNTKATFTFQFFNKITRDDNNCYWSKYDNEELANYLESQLRFNLDKKGSSSKQVNWNDGPETRSLFEMLPKEFENYIWPVKKKVSCKAKGESDFSVKNYTDRIFIPTMTEYAQTWKEGLPYKFNVEGEAYEYWTKHTSTGDRIVNGVNVDDKRSLFVVTPCINSTNVICITTKGEFGKFSFSLVAQAIAPCFCI